MYKCIEGSMYLLICIMRFLDAILCMRRTRPVLTVLYHRVKVVIKRVFHKLSLFAYLLLKCFLDKFF